MSGALDAVLQAELERFELQNTRRRLREVPPGIFDLASNDYLSFARHPEVVEAACAAAREFGSGARASRLISGQTALHATLESQLAAFKGEEAALIFPSGYHANLGVVGALATLNATFFAHKRNHASLHDAVRSVGTSVRFWEFLDKLEELLKKSAAQRFIVTDAVFSMDGDLCDLPQLLQLAEKYDATILLDDAHGTGTLGATGRGATEHFDLKSERIIQIGTLSKALGSQGGFVAGSRVLIEFLMNKAHPFIYTTGLNPPAVGAALQALEILGAKPERVENLRQNSQKLARGLQNLGLNVLPQAAPILPVLLPDAKSALEWSEKLLQNGVWCPAIRPPTVKKSRLRLTACSEWNNTDFARIFAAFQTSMV